MTAQRPDILVWCGTEWALFSNPLESYYDGANPRPAFQRPDTATWRGYVATWEIRRFRLYLSAVTAWIAGPSGELREAGLDDLFPGHRGPVEASWFTGELEIPKGAELQYVHMGYGSIYEQSLLLTLRGGEIIRSGLVDNRNRFRGQPGDVRPFIRIGNRIFEPEHPRKERHAGLKGLPIALVQLGDRARS
jgi:hypothetical protein